MADAVTVQTLADGPANCIMKFTNVSDGTGEAAVLKVDVSTLSGAPREVAIERVYFSTDGMALQILWDATADVLALPIPANQSDAFDFREFGGIRNNSGAGKTGDILFTTVGHALNDNYWVILHLTKVY